MLSRIVCRGLVVMRPYWRVLLVVVWAAAGVAGIFLAAEVSGLAINLTALRAPRHRFLRVWTPTLHLYFPLAAIAAYKGCWELISSPFYWDKTAHGIHDGPQLLQPDLPQ